MSRSDIRLEHWTNSQFDDGRASWQDLVSRSQVNPLFMSWDWLHRWWQVFRAVPDIELRIIAGYVGDDLVLIAPFTRRSVSHRRFIRTTRLELLGHLWREPESVFSEFLDVIVDTEFRDAALRTLAAELSSTHDVSEVVFANISPDSDARRLAEHLATECRRGYLRINDRMTAHTVNLMQGFDAFVNWLPSDSRRKMIHHRSRLEMAHYAEVGEAGIDATFDAMITYLRDRWGGQFSQQHFREFHVPFARAMHERGNLHLSVLRDHSGPISIMYNLRIGSDLYNIQSAFRSDHESGLTPGYLHLGYCIEHAISAGIQNVHLLAGRGRSRDFKKDFAEESGEISTAQLLKSPWVASVFNFYDWVTARPS